MLAGTMIKRLARLLTPSTWKAFPAFYGALTKYKRGQDEAALQSSEECIRWIKKVPAEYLAFHATLLLLNWRSPEAAQVFKQVLTSTTDDPGLRSRYAAAYARYYLALIERTDEAVALNCWQEARDLMPAKGFASRYLQLPDSPVLS